MLRILCFGLFLFSVQMLVGQGLQINPVAVVFSPADTSASIDSMHVTLTNTTSVAVTVDSIGMPKMPFYISPVTPLTISPSDSLVLFVYIVRNHDPGFYNDSMTFHTSAGDRVITLSARLNYPLGLFSFNDLQFFCGDGNDTAMLVIDFNDGSNYEAYAWGFLFNDSISALKMVEVIDSLDVNLNFTFMGSFVNDIIYYAQSGLGGNPDYWSSWSGKGLHDWELNWGLAETIYPGSWFGFSYGFTNLAFPELPLAAPNTIGIRKVHSSHYVVCFPNPFVEMVNFTAATEVKKIAIYDIAGLLIQTLSFDGVKNGTIDMGSAVNGCYFTKIYFDNGNIAIEKLIKHNEL